MGLEELIRSLGGFLGFSVPLLLWSGFEYGSSAFMGRWVLGMNAVRWLVDQAVDPPRVFAGTEGLMSYSIGNCAPAQRARTIIILCVSGSPQRRRETHWPSLRIMNYMN
jgi:hypothetical protein